MLHSFDSKSLSFLIIGASEFCLYVDLLCSIIQFCSKSLLSLSRHSFNVHRFWVNLFLVLFPFLFCRKSICVWRNRSDCLVFHHKEDFSNHILPFAVCDFTFQASSHVFFASFQKVSQGKFENSNSHFAQTVKDFNLNGWFSEVVNDVSRFVLIGNIYICWSFPEPISGSYLSFDVQSVDLSRIPLIVFSVIWND